LHGEVAFRPSEKNAAYSPPPEVVLDGPSTTIFLPPNSAWQVVVSIPGYWCRREIAQLGPPDSETELRIVVWPLGTISGTVPKLATPLSFLEVETLAPRLPVAQEDAVKGALRCPTDVAGRWSCRMPAAVVDLKLSARGFAPEYRFAVHVPPGTDLDLGPLMLRQGASVAGFVAAAEGDLTPDCAVSLTPTDDANAGKPLSVRVQGEGFFQLTGIAPGNYLLEVTQAGYRAPKLAITVAVDSATYLVHPITLQRSPAPG
jgi:hypothetical protein